MPVISAFGRLGSAFSRIFESKCLWFCASRQNGYPWRDITKSYSTVRGQTSPEGKVDKDQQGPGTSRHGRWERKVARGPREAGPQCLINTQTSTRHRTALCRPGTWPGDVHTAGTGLLPPAFCVVEGTQMFPLIHKVVQVVMGCHPLFGRKKPLCGTCSSVEGSQKLGAECEKPSIVYAACGSMHPVFGERLGYRNRRQMGGCRVGGHGSSDDGQAAGELWGMAGLLCRLAALLWLIRICLQE